jgi:hypothetical protein
MTLQEQNELGILVDMGICMAAFAMARACDAEEVEAFFEINKERLNEQGFGQKDIDKMTAAMQDAVTKFKIGLETE